MNTIQDKACKLASLAGFEITVGLRAAELIAAHSKGYEDGYRDGVEANPYDGQLDPHSHLQYKMGYESGVSQYCEEIGEEEN